MNDVRFFMPVRIGRRAVWSLLIATGIAAVGGSTGCQKLLFKPEDPRTQFEVHDRMRQRYVPIEEEDVFGEPQPALRARLSPNT